MSPDAQRFLQEERERFGLSPTSERSTPYVDDDPTGEIPIPTDAKPTVTDAEPTVAVKSQTLNGDTVISVTDTTTTERTLRISGVPQNDIQAAMNSLASTSGGSDVGPVRPVLRKAIPIPALEKPSLPHQYDEDDTQPIRIAPKPMTEVRTETVVKQPAAHRRYDKGVESDFDEYDQDTAEDGVGAVEEMLNKEPTLSPEDTRRRRMAKLVKPAFNLIAVAAIINGAVAVPDHNIQDRPYAESLVDPGKFAHLDYASLIDNVTSPGSYIGLIGDLRP